MVSPSAFVAILQFRDDQGAPVLGLSNGRPTLLGRPIVENPAMAAAGSASKSVAFGDFSRYIVKRVSPIRVELSRHYKFDVDQVALKCAERVDGALIDTAAVAYLVSATT
jgi:HK97 family phage major capsid protein